MCKEFIYDHQELSEKDFSRIQNNKEFEFYVIADGSAIFVVDREHSCEEIGFMAYHFFGTWAMPVSAASQNEKELATEGKIDCYFFFGVNS